MYVINFFNQNFLNLLEVSNAFYDNIWVVYDRNW